MSSCEIEIKSLLGSEKEASRIRDKLYVLDPKLRTISRQKQLNHYFIGGNPKKLKEKLTPLLPQDKREEFSNLIVQNGNFSIRTRLIDNQDPIFVMKISLDKGTSHNTISRREFEVTIEGLTLSDLDQILLDSEFGYQAKWSRDREEYKSNNVNICFDKNAGYGYLAEFEMVVDDETKIKEADKEIRLFMQKIGVEELPQDRLERMFEYYNKNWDRYYGTDNIFVIT